MVKAICGVLSYCKAKTLLRGRQMIKIAANTYLREYSQNYEVIYHNSIILRLYTFSFISLFNGGYVTVTTKQRLNQFSPFYIYQRDYTWYISRQPILQDIEFYNGITLPLWEELLQNTPFSINSNMLVVADWLEDNKRENEGKLLRQFALSVT